jgi:hypothetical protein
MRPGRKGETTDIDNFITIFELSLLLLKFLTRLDVLITWKHARVGTISEKKKVRVGKPDH